MPTVAATTSLNARTLRQRLYIRRFTGSGPARTSQDYACRGRVWGERPAELVGSAQQYDYKALVFLPDLRKAGLSPLAITSADKLIHKGKELAISFPDNATRAEGDDLIAYELLVRG